jgi:hypothetical protein
MTNKILVVGFVCLSLAAVAQSNDDKKQAPSSTEVASPRDAASGQASGKRMHKPVTVTAEVGVDATSKDAAKPAKKTAADDWQAQAKSPKSTSVPTVKRVATGDVNGDGKADAAAAPSGQASGQPTGQNSAINNSHSNVKSPRDVATGQANGKRAQSPAAGTKDQNAPPAPKQ